MSMIQWIFLVTINYNHNYLAYCKTNNKTPDEMLELDDKEYPGGVMTGFILWISKKKQEFYLQHKECFLDRHTLGDIKRWEEFLHE